MTVSSAGEHFSSGEKGFCHSGCFIVWALISFIWEKLFSTDVETGIERLIVATCISNGGGGGKI